jgi:hypothetical protein
LTFVPGASFLPGFGPCLTTLPDLALTPAGLVTLPTPQPAFFSFFFAAFSFLAFRFGTVQAVYVKRSIAVTALVPPSAMTVMSTLPGVPEARRR